MKQRITKHRIRKILIDFKSVLKPYKLTFNARAITEMFDTRHTAIILPTKKINRIPGANSGFSIIRFILKAGSKPKGLLSLSPSGEFSHFSFGQDVIRFIQALNRFIHQKKIPLPEVLIIKAFHSGEYFFQVKVGKQPVQFFVPEEKDFAVISEAKIISRHNRQIKHLAAAQSEYTELKKVAKSKKYNHLVKLKYL